MRLINRFYIYCLSSVAILFQAFCGNAYAAAQHWESIDKQVQNKIYQINIGVDVRLKDGPWVQLTGLSPKQHYYVFTTAPQDQGYQIVGHGSCFPLATVNKQKTFFVTGEHVLAEAAETIEECRMFYAAMQLYACETTVDNNAEARLKELLNTVNLSLKQDLSAEEKNACIQTINTIWEYYDNNLSPPADPWRRAYNKYQKLAGLQIKTAYLLHAAGPVTQPPVEATLYKTAPDHKFDLAILTVKQMPEQAIETLDLDPLAPHQGQEIQAVGYPIATQTIDIEPVKYYDPTFTSGKIVKVMPDTFEFDALIAKGNSGGPVINSKGKVVGIVTLKEPAGNKKRNYGVAISARSIKILAPELFK